MSPLATTVAADAMTAEASSGGRLCGHLTLTVIGARDVPSIRDTVTGDVAVDLRANGGFHFRTPRARVVTVGRSSEAQLRWAASTAGAIQGADVLQVVVRSVPRLRPARALARTELDLHSLIDGDDAEVSLALRPKGQILLRICYKDNTPLFGLSLVDACRREFTSVPHIVKQCVADVEARGMNVNGIYRVAGNGRVVTAMRKRFDTKMSTASSSSFSGSLSETSSSSIANVDSGVASASTIVATSDTVATASTKPTTAFVTAAVASSPTSASASASASASTSSPPVSTRSGFTVCHDLISVGPETVPNVTASASLLKLYLRELPVPLLTPAAYDAFAESTSSGLPGAARARFCASALAELPPGHCETAALVLAHFWRVANSSENEMTPSALAICLGPSLFGLGGGGGGGVDRCSSDAGLLGNVRQINSNLEFLLTHWPVIEEAAGFRRGKQKRTVESTHGIPTPINLTSATTPATSTTSAALSMPRPGSESDLEAALDAAAEFDIKLAAAKAGNAITGHLQVVVDDPWS
eukprot:UC1_evm1s1756